MFGIHRRFSQHHRKILEHTLETLAHLTLHCLFLFTQLESPKGIAGVLNPKLSTASPRNSTKRP